MKLILPKCLPFILSRTMKSALILTAWMLYKLNSLQMLLSICEHSDLQLGYFNYHSHVIFIYVSPWWETLTSVNSIYPFDRFNWCSNANYKLQSPSEPCRFCNSNTGRCMSLLWSKWMYPSYGLAFISWFFWI